MVDNLLPDHVELPHVLDLAVHLVQLMTWISFILLGTLLVFHWGFGLGLDNTSERYLKSFHSI